MKQVSTNINKINNFSVGFGFQWREGGQAFESKQPTLITQEHVPYQSTCSHHSLSHFIIQPFPEKRTRSDRTLRALTELTFTLNGSVRQRKPNVVSQNEESHIHTSSFTKDKVSHSP